LTLTAELLTKAAKITPKTWTHIQPHNWIRRATSQDIYLPNKYHLKRLKKKNFKGYLYPIINTQER